MACLGRGGFEQGSRRVSLESARVIRLSATTSRSIYDHDHDHHYEYYIMFQMLIHVLAHVKAAVNAVSASTFELLCPPRQQQQMPVRGGPRGVEVVERGG
jgi:hypothetical protein